MITGLCNADIRGMNNPLSKRVRQARANILTGVYDDAALDVAIDRLLKELERDYDEKTRRNDEPGQLHEPGEGR